jgi:hypothetical protein
VKMNVMHYICIRMDVCPRCKRELSDLIKVYDNIVRPRFLSKLIINFRSYLQVFVTFPYCNNNHF